MLRRYIRSFAIIGLVAVGLTASASASPSLQPQVDFRDSLFADAFGKNNFSAEIDGIGFTVRAWRETSDGVREEAALWWDEADGLGILGTEDDELDAGEILEIDFDGTIGLSHLFVADLFDQEKWNGLVYSESGRLFTDSGFELLFSASELAGSWGDVLNGEAVLTLEKTIPVSQLFLTVPSSAVGSQNFAVLGFIDPPLPRVPAPAGAGLMLAGLVMLGLVRRLHN